VFDVLRGFLTFGLVIAILVVVVGAAIRSNIRVARIFGLIAIAVAVASAMRQVYEWYSKGQWTPYSAGQLWADIDRDSLLLVQPAVERYLFPALWSLIQKILEQPASIVLVAVGLIFLTVDHFQVARRPGPRPPPVWLRLYRWLRRGGKKQEEEEAAPE
jgi:hypothetical protein